MLTEEAIDKGAQEFKDEVLKSYWKTVEDLSTIFAKFPEAEDLFNVLYSAPEDKAMKLFLNKLVVRSPKDAFFVSTLLAAWNSASFEKPKFFEIASFVVQLFKYKYDNETASWLIVEELSLKKPTDSKLEPEMFFCFFHDFSSSENLKSKEVKACFDYSHLVNPSFGSRKLELLLQKKPKELKTKHFFCPAEKLPKLFDEVVNKEKSFSQIDLK